MSDLVDFEDLGQLDADDLRAVLRQVSGRQLLDALGGVPAALRHRLLTKLPAASATRLEAEIHAIGPISIEAARAAQQALIDALRRLGRGGQIAFDDPEDMVA